MASVRPLPPTPDELLAPVDHDQITEDILDAALAEFQEFGLRRASIDSVAERLGVGRMTVYRRFGGKDALAHAVMLRETKRYLDSVHHDIAGETVHSRIEEGFRAGVARNRERELLQTLLEREPLVASAYVVGKEAGQLLDYAITLTRNAIQQAPDAATYTDESMDAVATAMIRLAHSLVNAPPTNGIDDTYLRKTARDLLLPLLVAEPEISTPLG